tara:strand:+ start:27 stop:962 length:936 start_codon:yes stop_codon:yes gene_type:complete
MINIKKIFISIIIYLSLINFGYSQINFKIIMKINSEIITSYDLEKEINYLLALNPQLKNIDKNDLNKIAKRSIVKEVIRKNEILKYKKLELQNPQISNVLNNLIQNLNFSNEDQLSNYLNDFDISIDDLKKKIEIENEWKNMVYSKYNKSININRQALIQKIEDISKNNFFVEYNLSEIVFVVKKSISYKEQLEIIEKSISDNGFEIAANLFSISDSSKVGGKVGWISKNDLSKVINERLDKLDKDSHTSPIKIGNNFLILKINDTRKSNYKIDKNAELDRMINIERTKQLDKFSNIFFNKIKLNAKISEF